MDENVITVIEHCLCDKTEREKKSKICFQIILTNGEFFFQFFPKKREKIK